MVLVSEKPSNDISILQTKFGDRERHEARRVRLEAMPLDEHIESGHGERQACLKRGPAPMHDLLQMADERQHREHRLHQHPVLPRAALTQFQVGGVAFRGMKAGVAQDNHALFNLANEPLKGVIDVSTTILSSRHFLLDSWLLLSLGKQREQRGMRAQKAILRGPFARPPTPFAHSCAPSRCSCGSHRNARLPLGSENPPRSSVSVSPYGCL